MSSDTLILALKTILSESGVPNILKLWTMEGSIVQKNSRNLA